jgi:hypothetical protein
MFVYGVIDKNMEIVRIKNYVIWDLLEILFLHLIKLNVMISILHKMYFRAYEKKKKNSNKKHLIKVKQKIMKI